MLKRILMDARTNQTNSEAGADLLLRAFVGFTMAFAHGMGKLPPPQMMVDGVAGMGFPLPIFFAWAAALSEFLGGLLLVAGLFTRLAAAMMAFTMGVAAFVAHAADPFQRKEMALLFLAIALFYLIAGAGRFSVDAIMRKRK